MTVMHECLLVTHLAMMYLKAIACMWLGCFASFLARAFLRDACLSDK